jgi:hypothetical protein
MYRKTATICSALSSSLLQADAVRFSDLGFVLS